MQSTGNVDKTQVRFAGECIYCCMPYLLPFSFGVGALPGQVLIYLVVVACLAFGYWLLRRSRGTANGIIVRDGAKILFFGYLISLVARLVPPLVALVSFPLPLLGSVGFPDLFLQAIGDAWILFLSCVAAYYWLHRKRAAEPLNAGTSVNPPSSSSSSSLGIVDGIFGVLMGLALLSVWAFYFICGASGCNDPMSGLALVPSYLLLSILCVAIVVSWVIRVAQKKPTSLKDPVGRYYAFLLVLAIATQFFLFPR